MAPFSIREDGLSSVLYCLLMYLDKRGALAIVSRARCANFPKNEFATFAHSIGIHIWQDSIRVGNARNVT